MTNDTKLPLIKNGDDYFLFDEAQAIRIYDYCSKHEYENVMHETDKLNKITVIDEIFRTPKNRFIHKNTTHAYYDGEESAPQIIYTFLTLAEVMLYSVKLSALRIEIA
jgi:hypothetical protein